MEEATQQQQKMFSDNQKIQDIIQTIVQAVKPKRIYLFGSWAKQTAHPQSDFDLLIIADMNMPHRERRLAIRHLFPQPDFSLEGEIAIHA
jgi:predicted nucleotidyltransferase